MNSFHSWSSGAASAVLCLLAPMASATDINWNSTIGANNDTSAGVGSPMGGDFVFELGAFANDFVPTAANTASWAANWVALDRDAYNPVSKFFASKATLASNDLPFHFSKKAYIWGYNSQSPAEWILVTNNLWSWPFAGDGIQPPVTWSIGAGGTTAIIGQINGSGFQMRSASASGGSNPNVNPDAWRQQHFTTAERANPAVAGWQADADGDGASNLFELAAGSDPRKGVSRPTVSIERITAGSGASYLQTRLLRPHPAALTYGAEMSTDLAGWSSAGISVVADTPGEIVFRCVPGTTPRTFMRLFFGL